MLKVIPAIERAAHQIGSRIQGISGVNVTHAEAHVLAFLHVHSPVSIDAIHWSIGHKRSTLTSILRRLESRGYITRRSSDTDRRSFIIDLSPAGEKAAARIYRLLERLEREITRSVPPRDIRSFLRVLSSVEKRDEHSSRGS